MLTPGQDLSDYLRCLIGFETYDLVTCASGVFILLPCSTSVVVLTALGVIGCGLLFCILSDTETCKCSLRRLARGIDPGVIASFGLAALAAADVILLYRGMSLKNNVLAVVANPICRTAGTCGT